MDDETKSWDEKKQDIRGMKIQNFNLIMIVVTCIIYALLIVLTVNLHTNYENLEKSTENYISYRKTAEQLRKGSDFLTEQVRYYAETGDIKYAHAYFVEVNATRSRDEALDTLRKIEGDESGELETELEKALSWSNELMEIECYSMRLTAEAYGTDLSKLPKEVQRTVLSEEDAGLSADEMEKKGRRLVFDATYQEYKNKIYEHLNTLVENLISKTQWDVTSNSEDLSRTLHRQQGMITVMLLLNLIMFVFLTILVIRPLKVYIGNVQKDMLFDIVGAYEFKYLALTYNSIYEVNAENKEKLRHEAEHDKLTGVLNRTAFDGLTPYLIKEQIPMAVVIIDIDRFKEVNDTYGHEVGDSVLKKVAEQLQNHTRSEDYVVRYGGDEFVVIMKDITAENHRVISSKVAEINELLTNPSDGLPAVSISAGAAFTDTGYDDTVFKKADEALYRTKKAGRCGCMFFED